MRNASASVWALAMHSAAKPAISRASVPKSRGFCASCPASRRPAFADRPSPASIAPLIELPNARCSATTASADRRRAGLVRLRGGNA